MTTDQLPVSTESWNAAEKAVLAAFRAGRVADFGGTADSPGAELRAEVIAQLILSPQNLGGNATNRVQVKGALIIGFLDLGCGNLAPFLFNECYFEQQPLLNDASADFVGFIHCRLPGLSASRLKSTGPVWIHQTIFSHSVSFEDAHIIDIDACGITLAGSDGLRLSITMAGMRVEHDVQLSNSNITGSLIIANSHINGSLTLQNCKITTTSGDAIFGRLLRVGGNFRADGLTCDGGGIEIEGAEIQGGLTLANASVATEKGYALVMDHAVIKLGVHAEEFKSQGTVRLHHAIISCQVSFSGAKIESSDRYAVRADHAIIRGSILMNGGFTVHGSIMLHGADIECTLNMVGIIVKSGSVNDAAIEADAVKVGRHILAQKATIDGAMVLDSAWIGGRVFVGGKWAKPGNERSIILDRATFGGLSTNRGLECAGAISIAEAKVNGSITLDDSSIGSTEGKSVDLSGTQVFGDVTAQRSNLNGVFDAPQVEIRGDLRLPDAQLHGTPRQIASRGTPVDQKRGGQWRGVSLRLRGARVLGDVDLRGVSASRSTDLASSTIGQLVNLDGSALATVEGDALIASDAQIGQMQLRLREKPKNAMSLRNADLDILADDGNSWPPSGFIDVEGLRYRQFDSSLSCRQRLEWLASATPKFSPQPYEQLAAVYRDKGEAKEEREVRLCAVKRLYAERGNLQRGWGALQNATVGFGYRPARAFYSVVALWFLGTLWFAYGAGSCGYGGLNHRGLCPTNLGSHPTWNPAVLSIDLITPFSALGQHNAWRMTGVSVWVSILLTLSGWILVTTIAAAVARTFKH